MNRKLFKFHYKVRYKNIGAENEICAVTLVNPIDAGKISPNRHEISEIKSVDLPAFIIDLKENKNQYTPWLFFAVERMIEGQLL